MSEQRPKPEKRLVIIDGYSLLFRAFYGTRYLSTSDGKPTNALFGFVGMLFTLLTEYKPDAILVALDAPGKTFRHAEYAEYKGTRRETPPELISQLDASRDLIAALHVPTLEVIGYEADDIIGTVSRLAEENGYHTLIVTGDLDSLQLVDECVNVMTTRKGVTDTVIYDPAAVEERFGFTPDFLTDYKALAGDSSDNLPGVAGIGEKSAKELIQNFGHIDDIIARLPEVPEKFRKKLEGQDEQMRKGKWLATIDRHVPVEFDFSPYRITAEQLAQTQTVLAGFEFRQYVRKLPEVLGPYTSGLPGSVAAPTPVLTTFEPIRPDHVTAFTNLSDAQSRLNGRPYGIQIAPGSPASNLLDEPEPSLAYIAPATTGTPEVFALPLPIAAELFTQNPALATGHDLKPLYKSGSVSTLVPPGCDSAIAGYVLQSGRSTYDLPDLLQGYLDITPPEDPATLCATLIPLRDVMLERVAAEGQTRVLNDIELPLVPILAEMEQHGIGLNADYLRESSKSLQIEIEAAQARVYELAGQEFNIGSPKQIGEILFDKLEIPGARKTKTGYATGAEILQELAPTYPIASEILTYRELTKLKSTYTDALPRMVAADGRIHTTFNQTVAATGRLSSNDPNLQNIPIRTELGRTIRRAFVAAPGLTLGSFDYSQIELRILAHMCKDEALVNAFNSRVDVHTVTAALMFHIPNEEVTKEQRRLAKMLNYAVLYGVTDFGLAAQLGAGFSVSEAKELIRQYNERFPAVKAFTESVVEEARGKGFTTTLTGRRRFFPDIHAGNRNTRAYAERQAINAPIQGTAADLVKIAMIEVRRKIEAAPIKMLLQVHDELVFEMPESARDHTPEIRSLMEDALPMSVPIEVDAKFGPNWLDMTPA